MLKLHDGLSIPLQLEILTSPLLHDNNKIGVPVAIEMKYSSEKKEEYWKKSDIKFELYAGKWYLYYISTKTLLSNITV